MNYFYSDILFPSYYIFSNPQLITLLLLSIHPDISKYAGPSDLTDKNQADPTMFSAYQSKSPVKICSLLSRCRSVKLSLKVNLSCNSMFISLNKRFL